ncbi:MAG: hypothetical protein ACOYXT_07925 [Bacteroidota bacterium]
MNQQPDKLFRVKLEGYQKTAPSAAWSRIESKLDKKNDRTLWLKIAAALLLLASVAIFLWTSQFNEKSAPALASQKNNNKQQPVEQPKQHATKQESQPALAEKREVPRVNNIKENNKETANPQPEKRPESKDPERTIEKIDHPQDIVVAENNVTVTEVSEVESVIMQKEELPAVAQTSDAVGENVTEKENVTEEKSNVTLVYSAEEVNEKYLNKKSLAEATTGEKKPSTLRKLLDKAYDLKHNQDPFGDLRQKKNEILALNFKNEKQRSQNK